MDPITAIIGGIGLATSLFGASKARKAEKQQRRASAEITSTQNQAFAQQAATTKQLSNISAQQEALRKQALVFENVAMSRNIARQTQLARATALSKASNSGAQFSSGLAGVQAGISQQGADQQYVRNTNYQAGLQGFDLNQQALTIQTNSAIRQSAFNQRLATLGGQVNQANAQGDFGKSLFQTGVSIASNASNTSNVFKSLFQGGGS